MGGKEREEEVGGGRGKVGGKEGEEEVGGGGGKVGGRRGRREGGRGRREEEVGTVTLKESMIPRRHCKSRDQELQKGMIKCSLTLQQVT